MRPGDPLDFDPAIGALNSAHRVYEENGDPPKKNELERAGSLRRVIGAAPFSAAGADGAGIVSGSDRHEEVALLELRCAVNKGGVLFDSIEDSLE